MNIVARGFSRLDAVAVVAVAGVLTVCAVPALSEVRFDAMRQVCVSNFMRYHGYSSQYAWDSGGQFWSQDWYAGMEAPADNDVVPMGTRFATDSEAAAVQAVASMRRLSGWGADRLPLSQNWAPQVAYSHLPLLEYLGGDPFPKFLICPADSTREQIAEGRDDLVATLERVGVTEGPRAAFRSSYAPDFFTWNSSGQPQTMFVGGQAYSTEILYRRSQHYDTLASTSTRPIPGSLGPRPVSDVAFPSQKVFLSDEYARHHGPTRFYAYADARQDLLFHDGSVRNYRTDYTNPGWSLSDRRSMRARYQFQKKPDPYGFMPPGSDSTVFPAGWYKWTRGGLLGWDVPRSPSRNGKSPSQQIVESELNTTGAFW